MSDHHRLNRKGIRVECCFTLIDVTLQIIFSIIDAALKFILLLINNNFISKNHILTFKSATNDQLLTNFSFSRWITAALSRAVSLRVRPEPQQL